LITPTELVKAGLYWLTSGGQSFTKQTFTLTSLINRNSLTKQPNVSQLVGLMTIHSPASGQPQSNDTTTQKQKKNTTTYLLFIPICAIFLLAMAKIISIVVNRQHGNKPSNKENNKDSNKPKQSLFWPLRK